jgi:branched-subunit amino acid aminotransferase/4-amino-4-deoxychorismate lyase
MANDDRAVLVNGILSSDGRVPLDADDPGLLLGHGIFETMRTYAGVVFELDAHLRRLTQSAESVGVVLPSLHILKEEILRVVEARKGESVVRLTLTVGGVRIVRAGPLPSFSSGFRCATRSWTPTLWLPGTAKHNSRLNSLMAVRDADVDEVLWVDADGFLLEGTRSNIFGVFEQTLWTPPLDGRCLAGVTREVLLHLAQEIGISVREQPMQSARRFDELYLSSTLKELTPIIEMDGKSVQGSGPIGDRLSSAFAAAVRN